MTGVVRNGAQAIGKGSQVRFRNKGFCLQPLAGFRCFNGGTLGTVEQVTSESVRVRLDQTGQLMSWDPSLQDLELSVLTGHHSRTKRGLIALAIGGVTGVAFGLVAPSLVCLFCSTSEIHSAPGGPQPGSASPSGLWAPWWALRGPRRALHSLLRFDRPDHLFTTS